MEVQKISDELEGIVESKRIPNALIFEADGSNSELKMSLEFAKKILLSKETDPVNQNKIIRGIESLSYPDLHIVFPIPISNNKKKDLYDYHFKSWAEMAVKNNMKVSLSKWKDAISYGNKQPIINIDSVRSLIKKLSVSSFYSNYRVIIFWMADKMNEDAANMLLKTIEEPGRETIFLLISEDLRNILPTIISRCQVVNTGSVITKDYDGLENSEFESLFSNLMRSAFQANKNPKSLAELVNWSRDVGKMDKQDAQSFFKFSIELLRQAYLKNMEIEELVSFTPSTEFNFEAFSKFITQNNIEGLSSGFENAIYESSRNIKLSMIATDIAFKTTKLIHGG
tara:strand:+ start:4860 stop:5879 length:1020 start_codon:yes stop_codon:yes gene_type:complete